MNANLPIVTRRDVLRLLEAGGQTAPSPERIELTRWLIQTCREQQGEFSKWNEPLYPALDSFGDMELLEAVSETFGTEIDEVEIRAGAPETLGDLVAFLEPHLTTTLVFQRLVNDSQKMGHAICSTQAAFYTVRRKVCEAGSKCKSAHSLRPSTPLAKMPIKQGERFVDSIRAEYGLMIAPYQAREQWKQILHILLIASTVFCGFIVTAFMGNGLIPIVLCVGLNITVGVCLLRFGRASWPQDMQTFGDVARKIAAMTTDVSPQAAL